MGMFGNAFKPGGAGRDVAGYVGDALLRLSGGDPVYAPMKAQGLQQQQMLQREMMLARYKQQNPDPTGTMQNVGAAGFQQGTPEYQQFMQKILQQPHYMVLGNAENGQQVIDANNPPQMGGGQAGPPAEAIARLKSNPAEAAQFDEIFGPGSAARAMGGQ
jgi:hypothetical protein